MAGISTLLFTAAILLAAAVLLGRRLSRSRASNRALSQPARSPRTALAIQRFSAINEVIAQSRCTCGGRLSICGEGSRQSLGGLVRVVHAECQECEEPHSFFFHVSKVLH